LVLDVQALTGGYSRTPVIKDLNFTLAAGTITALIGLNGAGKSTTIKHILGLLTPQKGSITLNDLQVQTQPEAYRQQVAYVPEMPVLYPALTLREHLDMTIMAYNLDAKQAWQQATPLLKQFRLDKRLDWFPANFSKGMQQKVMIVCAFMIPAALYIIDEPFTGLDPIAVHDLLTLIAQAKQRGAAILMSTHVLATAQQHADQFLLLHQGQLVAQGDLPALRKAFDLPQASLEDIYLKMTEMRAAQ
jgi:ABC-2 type transport system ATP-binding protein